MNSLIEYFVKLNFNQKILLKRIVYLFPVIFLSFFIHIKMFTNNTGIYQSFFAFEDGPIEWGTTVVYLLAALVALSIGIDFYKEKSTTYGVLYLIFALGFFFIGMEEISWGQRLFQVESPEFFQKYNAQQEITLHNLGSSHVLHAAYILVGFYGAFARKILPKFINKRHKEFLNLFAPARLLMFYFLPTFIFYTYVEYIVLFAYKFWRSDTVFGIGKFIMPKDQETIEFVLALGFLGFVLINKYRQSRNQLLVGTQT
jgi:hypothetical protein